MQDRLSVEELFGELATSYKECLQVRNTLTEDLEILEKHDKEQVDKDLVMLIGYIRELHRQLDQLYRFGCPYRVLKDYGGKNMGFKSGRSVSREELEQRLRKNYITLLKKKIYLMAMSESGLKICGKPVDQFRQSIAEQQTKKRLPVDQMLVEIGKNYSAGLTVRDMLTKEVLNQDQKNKHRLYEDIHALNQYLADLDHKLNLLLDNYMAITIIKDFTAGDYRKKRDL